MESIMFLKLLLVLPLLHWCVIGKECTNIPTELSSHTIRYDLLSSNNDTLKQEMFSHYHLTPTDDSAWASLLPRKILKDEDELDWMMLYRKMKKSGGDKVAKGFLNEMSLHDVRLEPGSIHWQAQQTNLEYLLMLDVDSLVWSFRKNAGLQAPGKPYGGWEAPDGELRGHFVGHYLSATAQMWASTHDTSLKANMNRVVRALATCQDKIGTGYLSAFPSEQFDRFEAIQPVWAPYYTIHKIMAGLLDQYIFANDNGALRMTEWMADYFYKRVKNVISKHTVERHWLSINEETGGMNDILYRLYNITGNMKHLWLAHLFDKPCFLGELALKADDISGFHANSHIPIVIGSQMRYEATGDPLYKEIGTFFMNIVNSSHTYATGGTSVSEFWSDPKRLATTLQTENEESCTTYNMLKVSRNLFRWTKEMAYADYHERALTNGVLSIQRGKDPGVMIYMLPLGLGESKERSFHGWGTQFDSFWCCYGTGIESFSKLGDSIYFEEWEKVPVLYVIQYISSSLNWTAGRVLINQKVEPVVSTKHYLGVTVTISLKEQEAHRIFTLKFRIPFWAHSKGLNAVLNGHHLNLPASGNFLTVTRKWSTGDKLTLELPLSLRTESIQDDRPRFDSLQAILYGPCLLVGLTNDDWDLQAESDSLSDWITPIPSSHNSHLISLTQEHGHITYALFNSNNSITMDKLPEPGTNSSVHATFRLVTEGSELSEHSGLKGDIGRLVMLEPFDLPGMFVVHEGRGGSLRVTDSSRDKDSIFSLAAGLNGKDDTVSLESEKHKGCFVHSENKLKLGVGIKLKCNAELSDDMFKEAASFKIRDGVSKYDPISFVANGVRRNFVLTPLYSLRDEYYTVYFNIHP